MSFTNFIEDKNANTLSFYSAKDIGFINNANIKDIITLSKKTNDTARLCLHKSSDDLLQLMLIFHPFKKDISLKKYTKQSGIYMLVDGEFLIEFYNDDKKLVNTIHLSKQTTIMCKILGQSYEEITI